MRKRKRGVSFTHPKHVLQTVFKIFKNKVNLSLAATQKEDQQLVFKADYRLMHVKSITECSKRAFCNFDTFIKLPFVIKTFVFSIFE